MCVYVFENNACVRKTTSVARVAHVLLLRSVAGYRGREYACVQALRVDWKRSNCTKASLYNLQKSTCVCLRFPRGKVGSAGTQGRPVAGFREHKHNWQIREAASVIPMDHCYGHIPHHMDSSLQWYGHVIRRGEQS